MGAPSFNVQVDGFAQVAPSRLDIFPLRCNAKFRAARDVPFFFFGDEREEAVVHKQNRIRLTAEGQGSRHFESQETPSFSDNILLRGKNG
jgi:hypothetical protein